MTLYAPGTQDRDPQRQNMAMQQYASAIQTNTDAIATNTADIATNTASIATINTTLGTFRSPLTAARTYYVRTDGSDSNTGLADTSGGAFLTIAKALSVASSVDSLSYQLTVNIGAGTWTVPVVLPRTVGGLRPILQGVGSTTIISVNSSDADAITADGVTPWHIQSMKLAAAGSNASGIRLFNGAAVSYSSIEFGACAGWGIRSMGFTGFKQTGACTVTGGGQGYIIANGFGDIASQQTTWSSAVTYSLATISATKSGGELDCNGCTFTNPGNVTGPRYFAAANGVIFTGGSGATFIPGTVAGSTASGGQYL